MEFDKRLIALKGVFGVYDLHIEGQTFVMADSLILPWPLCVCPPVHIPVTASFQRHPGDYYLQAGRTGGKLLKSVNLHILHQTLMVQGMHH